MKEDGQGIGVSFFTTNQHPSTKEGGGGGEGDREIKRQKEREKEREIERERERVNHAILITFAQQ